MTSMMFYFYPHPHHRHLEGWCSYSLCQSDNIATVTQVNTMHGRFLPQPIHFGVWHFPGTDWLQDAGNSHSTSFRHYCRQLPRGWAKLSHICLPLIFPLPTRCLKSFWTSYFGDPQQDSPQTRRQLWSSFWKESQPIYRNYICLGVFDDVLKLQSSLQQHWLLTGIICWSVVL